MAVVIDVKHKQGKISVGVTGEVDVSNADELRDALSQQLDQAPHAIEIDISQVPYIDSTGIGVLVGAAHRAQEMKIELTVVQPQRNVARVLTLLGVSDELGVTTD
jgi:anti-sigma B factor antagonist